MTLVMPVDTLKERIKEQMCPLCDVPMTPTLQKAYKLKTTKFIFMSSEEVEIESPL
jgi:hypothetical protein